MNKIININIAGRLLPIEDSAYAQLDAYLGQLKSYFGNTTAGKEILYDIEDRIAELLQQRLRTQSTSIGSENIAEVIGIMGRPEEIIAADQEADEPITAGTSSATNDDSGTSSSSENAYSTPKDDYIPSPPKRLRRDAGHKTIGGVASGIAHYLNIDPIIIKLLFMFTTLFWGFSVILYLALWILVPAAILPPQNLRKRLYRNPSQKIIGGVCSGLASYFSTENYIVRLVFVAPFIIPLMTSMAGGSDDLWGMFPGSILVYVILLILMPKPRTMAERLEANGEVPTVSKLSAAAQGGYIAQPPRGGSVLRSIAKGIALLILITMGTVFISLLIAFITVLVGLRIDNGIQGAELWQLVTTDGNQINMLYISLFAFIASMLYLIVTFIVRIISGKSTSNGMRYARYSVLAIWILSIIGIFSVMGSILGDFQKGAKQETELVYLPTADTTNIVGVDSFEEITEFNIPGNHDLSMLYDEDSKQWRIPLSNISIVPSADSAVHIISRREARGANKAQATERMGRMEFAPSTAPGTIALPMVFRFSSKEPYRLQLMNITMSLPKEKYFRWMAKSQSVNSKNRYDADYLEQGKVYYFNAQDELTEVGAVDEAPAQNNVDSVESDSSDTL